VAEPVRNAARKPADIFGALGGDAICPVQRSPGKSPIAARRQNRQRKIQGEQKIWNRAWNG